MARPGGIEPALDGVRGRRPADRRWSRNGWRDRARTCDLLVNGQLLYQLSYSPKKWWTRTEPNRRPAACRAAALPTELRARNNVIPLQRQCWCQGLGSNQRRARLQRAALPLSYLGGIRCTANQPLDARRAIYRAALDDVDDAFCRRCAGDLADDRISSDRWKRRRCKASGKTRSLLDQKTPLLDLRPIASFLCAQHLSHPPIRFACRIDGKCSCLFLSRA